MDIVEWLRAQQRIFASSGSSDQKPGQAADEIERLRDALRRIADGVEVVRERGHTEMVPVEDAEAIAREALKE